MSIRGTSSNTNGYLDIYHNEYCPLTTMQHVRVQKESGGYTEQYLSYAPRFQKLIASNVRFKDWIGGANGKCNKWNIFPGGSQDALTFGSYNDVINAYNSLHFKNGLVDYAEAYVGNWSQGVTNLKWANAITIEPFGGIRSVAIYPLNGAAGVGFSVRDNADISEKYGSHDTITQPYYISGDTRWPLYNSFARIFNWNTDCEIPRQVPSDFFGTTSNINWFSGILSPSSPSCYRTNHSRYKQNNEGFSWETCEAAVGIDTSILCDRISGHAYFPEHWMIWSTDRAVQPNCFSLGIVAYQWESGKDRWWDYQGNDWFWPMKNDGSGMSLEGRRYMNMTTMFKSASATSGMTTTYEWGADEKTGYYGIAQRANDTMGGRIVSLGQWQGRHYFLGFMNLHSSNNHAYSSYMSGSSVMSGYRSNLCPYCKDLAPYKDIWNIKDLSHLYFTPPFLGFCVAQDSSVSPRLEPVFLPQQTQVRIHEWGIGLWGGKVWQPQILNDAYNMVGPLQLSYWGVNGDGIQMSKYKPDVAE